MNILKSYLLIIISIFFHMHSQAQLNPKIIDLSNYGVLPNTGNNSTALVNKAIQSILSKIGKKEPIILKFKKGRYDFHPEGALVREYYISNHDQDNPKTVGMAFENCDNITIDGQGSDFIYHGRMLPIALIENKNLTLKNIHIDFERPQICQVRSYKMIASTVQSRIRLLPG